MEPERAVERAEQDHDFADESAEAGQAEIGEETDGRKAGVDGHGGGQAAEAGQFAVVGPLVNHADQEEHHGAGDAVGDHHEEAPLMAAGVIMAAPRTTNPMWLTEE